MVIYLFHKCTCWVWSESNIRGFVILVFVTSTYMSRYEDSLKSLWTHIFIPSQNFVEVRWRPLFRSASPGKRCTSYNAPPTSRKRSADRRSLRNFLPRSSIFMVGKAQKSYGARSGLYFGYFNGFRGSTFSKPNTEFTSVLASCEFWAFPTMKRSTERRNFEVINSLQHVFEKWVERCKKCIIAY
jgi:hypothetical protein